MITAEKLTIETLILIFSQLSAKYIWHLIDGRHTVEKSSPLISNFFIKQKINFVSEDSKQVPEVK
jgi:hypothetical protein